MSDDAVGGKRPVPDEATGAKEPTPDRKRGKDGKDGSELVLSHTTPPDSAMDDDLTNNDVWMKRVASLYRNGGSLLENYRPDYTQSFVLTPSQELIRVPLQLSHASKPFDPNTWAGLVSFMESFFAKLQTRRPYPTTHELDTPPYNVITEVPVSVRTEKNFAHTRANNRACNQFLQEGHTCLEQRLQKTLDTEPPENNKQYVAHESADHGVRDQYRLKNFKALQKFAHSSRDGHVQGRIMHLGSHRPDNKVYMTFVPNQEQTKSKPEVAQRFVICFLRESKRAITNIFQHETCSDDAVVVSSSSAASNANVIGTGDLTSEQPGQSSMSESALIELKMNIFLNLYKEKIGENLHLWEKFLVMLYDVVGQTSRDESLFDSLNNAKWWTVFHNKISIAGAQPNYPTTLDVYHHCEVLYRMAKTLHKGLHLQDPYALNLKTCFEQAERPFTEARNHQWKNAAEDAAVNAMLTHAELAGSRPGTSAAHIQTGLDDKTHNYIDAVEENDSKSVYAILDEVNQNVQAPNSEPNELSVAAEANDDTMQDLLAKLNTLAHHSDFATAKQVWHALMSISFVDTQARVSLSNTSLFHDSRSNKDNTLFNFAAVRAMLLCVMDRSPVPNEFQENTMHLVLRLVDVFGVCMIVDVHSTITKKSPLRRGPQDLSPQQDKIVSHNPLPTEKLLEVIAEKHKETDLKISRELQDPEVLRAMTMQELGSDNTNKLTQVDPKMMMKLATHCACQVMLSNPHDMLAIVMNSTDNWCFWYHRCCKGRLHPASTHHDEMMPYENVYRSLFHRLYHYLGIMLHNNIRVHSFHSKRQVQFKAFQRLVIEYGFFDSVYGQRIVELWKNKMNKGVEMQQQDANDGGKIIVENVTPSEVKTKNPMMDIVGASAFSTIFTTAFKGIEVDGKREMGDNISIKYDPFATDGWKNPYKIDIQLQHFSTVGVTDSTNAFSKFFDKLVQGNSLFESLASFCIKELDKNIESQRNENPFQLNFDSHRSDMKRPNAHQNKLNKGLHASTTWNNHQPFANLQSRSNSQLTKDTKIGKKKEPPQRVTMKLRTNFGTLQRTASEARKKQPPAAACRKTGSALAVVGAPAGLRAPAAARAAAAGRAPTAARTASRAPTATQRGAKATPATVALPLAFARACPVLSVITPRVARGHVERALARQRDQELLTTAAAQLQKLRF